MKSGDKFLDEMKTLHGYADKKDLGYFKALLSVFPPGITGNSQDQRKGGDDVYAREADNDAFEYVTHSTL